MANPLKKLLLQLAGGTSKLITLAVVVLLVWGTVSPVGTLVWWLNQSTESVGKKRQLKQLPANQAAAPTARVSTINCYIIYLPGVGDASTDQLTTGEEWFLDQLVRLHPNCIAVRDVFPYSAANKDLGGQRFLAPLWRAAEQGKGWLENADVLIKIRNLWRLAISADDRYGPIYNQGIANAILERMNAVQPFPRQQQPLHLILIGTSGGVQVALGAGPYLNQWLKAKVTVVSLGGTFNGEEGFGIADHVYHLQGERDWIEDIGRVVFPSRWRWTIASPFNQARQQGRYTALSSGAHAHDGDEGYLGLAIAQPHITFAALTLQKVQQLPIWEAEVPRDRANPTTGK